MRLNRPLLGSSFDLNGKLWNLRWILDARYITEFAFNLYRECLKGYKSFVALTCRIFSALSARVLQPIAESILLLLDRPHRAGVCPIQFRTIVLLINETRCTDIDVNTRKCFASSREPVESAILFRERGKKRCDRSRVANAIFDRVIAATIAISFQSSNLYVDTLR